MPQTNVDSDSLTISAVVKLLKKMCGSLLSKFKCGNKVAPAQETHPPGTKEFPAKANLVDEPIEAGRRVEIPVARPRKLPPLPLPKKVPRKWREIERARKKRVEAEEIARHKMVKEILAKKKLAKEKLQRLQVEMNENLQAENGGETPVHIIVINKTESAIAFEVVFGSKWERTVRLSALPPRHLYRLHSPPPVTAEVLAAKQLAVREKRLKQLERVRDRARACA